MTDLMLKNIKAMENNERFPIDKQLFIDWMDEKVEIIRKNNAAWRETPYAVGMGECVDGEYDVLVDSVFISPKTDYHVYCGIQYLADAIGEELKFVENYCSDVSKYSFVYKDVEFFELVHPGEELR